MSSNDYILFKINYLTYYFNIKLPLQCDRVSNCPSLTAYQSVYVSVWPSIVFYMRDSCRHSN